MNTIIVAALSVAMLGSIGTEMTLTSVDSIRLDECFSVDLQASPVLNANTPFLTPPDFWSLSTTLEYNKDLVDYIGYFPFPDQRAISVTSLGDGLLEISGCKISLLDTYSLVFLPISIGLAEFKLVNPCVCYGNVNTLSWHKGCEVAVVPETFSFLTMIVGTLVLFCGRKIV